MDPIVVAYMLASFAYQLINQFINQILYFPQYGDFEHVIITVIYKLWYKCIINIQLHVIQLKCMIDNTVRFFSSAWILFTKLSTCYNLYNIDIFHRQYLIHFTIKMYDSFRNTLFFLMPSMGSIGAPSIFKLMSILSIDSSWCLTSFPSAVCIWSK